MRRPRRDSRRFLFRLLRKGSVGVEIGVWRGDFSARLLRAVRPAKLHLVDPWALQADEDHREAWYGPGAGDQAFLDAIHDGVVRRFDRQIAKGVVEVHRLPSAQAAQLFAESSLDWVYVDGDHVYDAVQADLNLFAPKLKPEGLLAGDDYGSTGWWQDGVTRAVDGFVARTGFEVVALRANQFVLRKPAGGREPAPFEAVSRA